MKKIIERILALVAAVILLQTLFFKFSGAEESIYIFTKMQIEPWGRYVIGFAELIAGGLLILRKSAIWGALLTVGLMIGAVFSHLFVLGIAVRGDGGFLFVLAIVTLLSSVAVLIFNRQKLFETLAPLLGKPTLKASASDYQKYT